MPSTSSLSALALSYLLGSIPWGLLLVRAFVGVDVRAVGSGNIGATNSMRAGGKKLGVAVFALDFAKGWVAAQWLARLDAQVTWLPIACGVAAVLGHCFSVWLRFRGGKGVATACGAMVAIDPWLFVIGAAAWVVLLASTRWVALASIGMSIAFAVAVCWRATPPRLELGVGTVALALLILARHRSNIARMLAGTEPKVFTHD